MVRKRGVVLRSLLLLFISRSPANPTKIPMGFELVIPATMNPPKKNTITPMIAESMAQAIILLKKLSLSSKAYSFFKVGRSMFVTDPR